MVPSGVDAPQLLGTLEVGVFIAIFLFGVVSLQGYTYFAHNSSLDKPWLKCFVGILLALELAHTLAAAHAIYTVTVVFAGLPEATKPANTYSLSITPVFETLITAMVQAFFAWRICILSAASSSTVSGDWKRRLSVWGIPVVCWILVVLRLVAGMAMSVEGFRDIPLEPDYFHYQDTYGFVITSALDVGVVLDVLITLSLCYYMSMMHSPYSDKLIGRLITWTIQTGLITSLTSAACVIAFQTMKHNFIWLALYTLLAKLYSNSLLVSLNARSSNRQLSLRDRESPTGSLKTWSRWESSPRPSPPGSPRSSLTVTITRAQSIDSAEFIAFRQPPSRLGSLPMMENASAGFLTVPEKAVYVRNLV